MHYPIIFPASFNIVKFKLCNFNCCDLRMILVSPMPRLALFWSGFDAEFEQCIGSHKRKKKKR